MRYDYFNNMKMLSLTYANGSKVSINSDEISSMHPIINEDFVAKTRIEIKNGKDVLVMETIEEILLTLKH